MPKPLRVKGGQVVVVDMLDGEGTAQDIRALGKPCARAAGRPDKRGRTCSAWWRRWWQSTEAWTFSSITRAAPVSQAAESEIEKIDRAHWDEIIAINLTSTMLCIKHVAPHMKRQQSGKIVNVSSRAARGTSWFGQVTPEYICAKIGVIGLTRQLAKELGPHGINVNCLVPSFTVSGPALQAAWDHMTDEERSHMIEATPLRRLPDPEELASVVVFLVSGESSYVTGACLDVNGGSLMA